MGIDGTDHDDHVRAVLAQEIGRHDALSGAGDVRAAAVAVNVDGELDAVLEVERGQERDAFRAAAPKNDALGTRIEPM